MFLLNGVLGWSGQEAARIPAVLKGLGSRTLYATDSFWKFQIELQGSNKHVKYVSCETFLRDG